MGVSIFIVRGKKIYHRAHFTQSLVSAGKKLMPSSILFSLKLVDIETDVLPNSLHVRPQMGRTLLFRQELVTGYHQTSRKVRRKRERERWWKGTQFELALSFEDISLVISPYLQAIVHSMYSFSHTPLCNNFL